MEAGKVRNQLGRAMRTSSLIVQDIIQIGILFGTHYGTLLGQHSQLREDGEHWISNSKTFEIGLKNI